MLNNLSKIIHEAAVKKGFYNEADRPYNLGENLMLLVSEVAEIAEVDRKPKQEIPKMVLDVLTNQYVGDEKFVALYESGIKGTKEEEFADVLIRLLSLAKQEGIDMDTHVALKIQYNEKRPHKHGKIY